MQMQEVADLESHVASAFHWNSLGSVIEAESGTQDEQAKQFARQVEFAALAALRFCLQPSKDVERLAEFKGLAQFLRTLWLSNSNAWLLSPGKILDRSVLTLSCFAGGIDDEGGSTGLMESPNFFWTASRLVETGWPIISYADLGIEVQAMLGYKPSRAARATRTWRAIGEMNSMESVSGVEALASVLSGSEMDAAEIISRADFWALAEEGFKERVQDDGQRIQHPTPPRGVEVLRPVAPAADARDELDFEQAEHCALDADGGRIKVWFGTDRKVASTAGGYSFENYQEDSARLTYGTCIVNVPRAHRFGHVDAALWRRITRVGVASQELRLDQVELYPNEVFFSAGLRKALGRGESRKRALVFVHGYNTSFVSAALRAGQLGFDLRVDGVTAFFSWPSSGRWRDYLRDREQAQTSVASFTEFLRVLVTESDVERVDLIVHSMGNQIVGPALKDIQVSNVLAGRKLGCVVLAAPDISPTLFRQLASHYATLSSHATMYISPVDRALGLSRWISDTPRAGFAPPVTVVQGVDTIDVSDVDVSVLGHGYFGSAAPVLSDIRAIFDGGVDPAGRPRISVVRDGYLKYWRLNR